jgi:hypothetical protein
VYKVGVGVSGLYTWQDRRCSPTYLETLPHPSSHLTINRNRRITPEWFFAMH